MLAFDRQPPFDSRAVRQTVALELYTETDTHWHVLEGDLEEGRNGPVRLEGSSVVAPVHTSRTPRKV